MKHLLTFLFLLTLPLAARENPFKPVIDNTVLPVTSNKVEKAPPFKEANVTLPSDARILTSVAIYYQALDGSVKKEVVSIDRSIDWHDPIVIRQVHPRAKKPAAKTLRRPLPAAKPLKTASKKRQKPKKSAAASSAETAEKTLRFAPLPFVTVELEGKSVHIVTADEKVRSFHLSNPFKIVVDFRRNAAFLTKHKEVDLPPFKAVDIGNHEGYYRVVVTFDAPYRYRLTKTSDGYLIRLR
ncbi:AMIN domain-containing protein [Hydrogenimonas sp. SS33]|uniref:AMIN domain-containing protein n=1 Tax=Hydrogenimonas leucolamina TaxID=2954236 RepID=UPI00336C2D4B